MSLTIEPHAHGFALSMDEKIMLTPRKKELVLPTQILAERVQKLWNDKMPTPAPVLLALSYSAIDVMEGSREVMNEAMLAYAETDLILTRAEAGALLEREEAAWNPVMQWAMQRFDVSFKVAKGIMPVEQAEATLRALKKVLESFSFFEMSAFAFLTQSYSSLLLALAVKEKEISAETAFTLSRIDEDYQAETWGVDAGEAMRSEKIKKEVQEAEEFLQLLA